MTDIHQKIYIFTKRIMVWGLTESDTKYQAISVIHVMCRPVVP
jgi:hypothetical protein